jgi:formate-dependent nitrite reductase membrane component NrfD
MPRGYYSQPLLKPPVWTWEVPAYFFVGGVAGVAAMIAAAGALADAEVSLVRHARWIAAIGALVSPALLISDLGRPDRFLNMLRVFKTQSPMSVGAWTLAVFTPAVLAALIWDPASPSTGSFLARLAGHAGGAVGAATGLILATYTGVLLGVTAIPVWSAHARHLPYHFGASSLGAAVGLLELLGHRTAALNALGIASALALTVMRVYVEMDRRPASVPLKSGASGSITRAGDLLSGPVSLVLRLFLASSATARTAAALSALAGSAVTRFGWIAAGRASVALTLAALVSSTLLALGPQDTDKLDLSTKALVAAASKYVVDYEEQFKFLVAEEEYTQRVFNRDNRITAQRRLTGEMFLTYLPGDAVWIAVHDFAEVDGKPIRDREDLRLVLQKGDVSGTAARVVERNARYNIGRLGRNFNEPTLPLLLLDARRVKTVAFDRREVVTTDGRTRVTLAFEEREPSLIRNARDGRAVTAKGSFTIDAETGRIERTEFALDVDNTKSRLQTEYRLDTKLDLWVPVVFRERYEDRRERELEIILCEARYTNYRRFQVTGRIK